MTDDFLRDDPNREAILNGEMRFDAVSAREIYPKMKFLNMTEVKSIRHGPFRNLEFTVPQSLPGLVR